MVGLFFDFSQKYASFMRATAVCSATFRRDLPLQLLNHYQIAPPSQFSKPPPSLRLRVLFFVSCVIRIYLSIDVYVHFSPGLLPVAAGFVCYYTAAILPAATSEHSIYWLEEVVGPATQCFGEWASASRAFSAINDLIAVSACG